MENLKIALRPTEAAAALGVSRSKLYQLMAEGVVPSVYIGGVRVVPVEALRKLVERGHGIVEVR